MSDINSINYQPLEADEHPYKLVFRRNMRLSVGVFAGIVVLCVVFLYLGIAALVIWLSYVGRQVAAVKNGAWKDFAAANGWQLNMELAPETLLPQSLAFGYNRTYAPVITLQAGPVRSDLFAYKTTVPEGKSSQTYSYSVARVILPAEVPHMMLRAKRGALSGMRHGFTNPEVLPLEGDFDSYFALQIEKGQEVNALQVLTPDVMQTLIGYSQREDIEIMGADTSISLWPVTHARPSQSVSLSSRRRR